MATIHSYCFYLHQISECFKSGRCKIRGSRNSVTEDLSVLCCELSGGK